MSGRTIKRCPSPLHVGERELPFTEFHRSKATKDGYKSWCKQCISAKYFADKTQQQARSQRWYEKHGEELKMKMRTQYATDPVYREKVRFTAGKWARDNPELAKKAYREWAEKNRDHINRQARERNAGRREALRVYLRKWRAAHPERFTEYNRRYNTANPDVGRAAKHRRRARELAAPGVVTKDQLRARWDYYNGKCWMCGADATQMDHIKPIGKGGGSWASNLRPACKPCNGKKGHRWPFPTSMLFSPWSP